MPSGYTEPVASGKIIEFKEYALLCARAFGACISLRDEPLGLEIPEFKVNDYYLKRMQETEEEVASLLSMTQEDKEINFNKYVSDALKSAEEKLSEQTEIKQRYEKMLEQARHFDPPSPEHYNYKSFMIEQLKQSIEWDCSDDYYLGQIIEIKSLSLELWFKLQLYTAQSDLDYYKEQWQEEQDRVDKNNLWVKQLKESLGV